MKFGVLCTSSISRVTFLKNLKSFIHSQQIWLDFDEDVEAIGRVNQNKYYIPTPTDFRDKSPVTISSSVNNLL